MIVTSLHEGSAVNGSVAFASPILIDGASARRWVRGYRVSQLRLRHLTCGRARSTVPHHNASCTRRRPGETRTGSTVEDDACAALLPPDNAASPDNIFGLDDQDEFVRFADRAGNVERGQIMI